MPKKFNHEPHKPHEQKREFHAKVRDVRVKSSQSFGNNPGNQSMTDTCLCGSWLSFKHTFCLIKALAVYGA
jgi:hypothetical protein